MPTPLPRRTRRPAGGQPTARTQATIPSGNKADHTQVRFWSGDIEKDVAELVAKGIEFDEYDTETFKTVNHVVTTKGIGRSAWFKDLDGNTIALFQPE